MKEPTQEQKTIAIAKWQGFRDIRKDWVEVLENGTGEDEERLVGIPTFDFTVGWCKDSKSEDCFLIPNYFGDLNIINNLVAKLKHADLAVYGDCLNEIVGAFYDDYYDGWMADYTHGSFAAAMAAISQATAEQKCDALIRALNLNWKKENCLDKP